jgi:predicted transcriptional regulator
MKKRSRYINVNLDYMDKFNLSVTDMALLSHLTSLSENKGYCYASTKHLSDTLRLPERTLYRALNKLEENGFIKRVTKSTGHYGKERKIFISPDAKLARY